MGETALVAGLISDSIELVRKLDEIDTGPTLVAWYLPGEDEDWRLLIAGPTLDALLRQQQSLAYKRIAEAITALDLHSLSISFVKLMVSSEPLPRALQSVIRTPADAIIQAHFTDTTLNGFFIKGMVILRSTKSIAAGV